MNCYVIKGEGRSLVIDTGFKRPECQRALEEGLAELGIHMEDADLFLTHLHSDHTGLAEAFAQAGSTIYMNRSDYGRMCECLRENIWLAAEETFRKEGFPQEELEQQKFRNPARIYAPEAVFPAVTVEEGDLVEVGGLSFRCIVTPGHTPGHTCLYMEDEKLMFLGDHVLFDITPNITSWEGVHNSLGDYLKSLDLIEKYEIAEAYPAHRGKHISVYERIAEIKEHHKHRLEETYEVLRAHEGAGAYEVASHVTWSMRGRNWGEFPVQQKWFAVGETVAHLDYLLEEGRIRKTEEDGRYHYWTME